MSEKEIYKLIDLNKDYDTIVKELDDNHTPIRLSSMTNHTYKIKVNGKSRVIRIPGKGTEKFIDRKKESFILKLLSDNNYPHIPKIIYNDKRGIIVTEELSKLSYKIYNSGFSRTYIILEMLDKLHNIKLDFNNYHDYWINIISELDHYLDIYKDSNLSYNNCNKELELEVKEYIKNHQYDNLSLCHRDLMYNNIMINEKTLENSKLIDWEYSGICNKYWDLGCFLSEVQLWFNDYFILTIELFNKEYGFNININDVLRWCAIVDYVWSEWSLAKTAQGEDNYKYGQDRYNNFIKIWRKVNNEK